MLGKYDRKYDKKKFFDENDNILETLGDHNRKLKLSIRYE